MVLIKDIIKNEWFVYSYSGFIDAFKIKNPIDTTDYDSVKIEFHLKADSRKFKMKYIEEDDRNEGFFLIQEVK